MKLLLLVGILVLLPSCGMTQNVKGGTTHKVDVNISMDYSICEDAKFTTTEKLRCIELLYEMGIDADIEGISGLADAINNEETN